MWRVNVGSRVLGKIETIAMASSRLTACIRVMSAMQLACCFPASCWFDFHVRFFPHFRMFLSWQNKGRVTTISSQFKTVGWRFDHWRGSGSAYFKTVFHGMTYNGFCQSIWLNLSENSCYHTASYCWVIPQMYVPISIHTENDLRSLQSKKTIHSSCCRPEPEHSPDSLNHCVRWNIALSMLPLFFYKRHRFIAGFLLGAIRMKPNHVYFSKKCNTVEGFCVPKLLSNWSSSIRGLHLCNYGILTWGRIPS